MTPKRTLKVFSLDQLARIQHMLATKVVQMGGRKLEEGDWTEIYCAALEIPKMGWSNLNIDVIHGALGIEQKLLCTKSKDNIVNACGTSPMHPSLTRSIRIAGDTTKDPNVVMRDVFTQYAELVEQRRSKVRELSGLSSASSVEMRSGWLLWQTSLRQFLYFEEPMLVPNPSDYYARWQENRSRGQRKASVSLWIFETAEPQRKRYSVTTDAGAKIQPYFDVPPPNDENLYLFTVIGEVIHDGLVRAWVTERTRKELESTVGGVEANRLSEAILEGTKGAMDHAEIQEFMQSEERAVSVEVTADAYETLCKTFETFNDDLRFRALLVHLKRNAR